MITLDAAPESEYVKPETLPVLCCKSLYVRRKSRGQAFLNPKTKYTN